MTVEKFRVEPSALSTAAILSASSNTPATMVEGLPRMGLGTMAEKKTAQGWTGKLGTSVMRLASVDALPQAPSAAKGCYDTGIDRLWRTRGRQVNGQREWGMLGEGQRKKRTTESRFVWRGAVCQRAGVSSRRVGA